MTNIGSGTTTGGRSPDRGAAFLAVLTVVLMTCWVGPAFADPYPPSWSNGLGTAIHFSLAISKAGLYGVHTDGNTYRIEKSAMERPIGFTADSGAGKETA